MLTYGNTKTLHFSPGTPAYVKKIRGPWLQKNYPGVQHLYGDWYSFHALEHNSNPRLVMFFRDGDTNEDGDQIVYEIHLPFSQQTKIITPGLI